MSAASTVPPPPLVMWAQRPTLVFLSVCLEDCKEPEIKVDADKLHFKGVGGTDKKLHEVTINFFKEIDPEKSKFAVRERVIEFALEKKEHGPYWDRLMKDKNKYHWLKIDFNKWKAEDESDDEEAGSGGGGGGGGQDLEEMMRTMGGLGGMGGGGMEDMGDLTKARGKMERPSLDDLDAEDDSDDEELPDLD